METYQKKDHDRIEEPDGQVDQLDHHCPYTRVAMSLRQHLPMTHTCQDYRHHHKNVDWVDCDQRQEWPVIISTNTVIEPDTVVIKLADASVTGWAVLAGLDHQGIAMRTLVLQVRELLCSFMSPSLSETDCLVCGITQGQSGRQEDDTKIG